MGKRDLQHVLLQFVELMGQRLPGIEVKVIEDHLPALGKKIDINHVLSPG